jgi:hypothetical protein
MKEHAVMIGLGASLAVCCLAQQTSWKTEHHEGLLIAPHATGVRYVEWPGAADELRWSVQEPYPATRLRKFVCDELKQKGWRAKSGCSDTDQWWKTPFKDHGILRTNYRWQTTLVKENGDTVVYLWDYTGGNGANYLQMLDVQAVYSAARVGPKPEPQYSSRAEHARPAAKAAAKINAAPPKVDFGEVKLANISPPRVLTYTFFERTEVQDISVQTSGDERLDFANTGTGSCRGSSVYRAGDTCTVDLTFAPRSAAERRGFVLLQESSGSNVMTELDGTGIGESGQSAKPMTSSPTPRFFDAGDRMTAVIPDHPVELGQPVRISLKFTDPNVIGIGEVQTEGDHTFSNIRSGSAVGSGAAKIVYDTGLTKTMEVIPLATGKLKLGIMSSFADGGFAAQNYTLEVAPSAKGLKHFFLNHGSPVLAIVLEDKPQDRQKWLAPEVAYQQLEYPIYLENSNQIRFTALQPTATPVILLDANGMVHGLRPGKATIIGDFDGVEDKVVVTVYTKESAPLGYRSVLR